jgi:hypothetical protein
MGMPHAGNHQNGLSGVKSFTDNVVTVISYCVTRPTHRHMGVGTMMMEWGLKVADKMALPVFVESTEDGEKFYEKNDFKVIESLILDASIPNQGREFEQVRKRLMPVPYFVMARPLGGKSGPIHDTKHPNGIKQINGAGPAKATSTVSNGSYSQVQFIDCSFTNCHFNNCSISNGKILIRGVVPVTQDPSSTGGHDASKWPPSQ